MAIQIANNVIGFPEYGKLVVKVPDQTASLVMNVVPSMKLNNGYLLEVPWTDETCRQLYDLGINALPATSLQLNAGALPLVEGKYQPMQHQLATAAFISLHKRCYVLNEPRTGKTGALIMAMDYLQRQRKIVGGVCIITTATTLNSVWMDSLEEMLPNATINLVHGAGKKQALERPADFYVTNYDSVRIMASDFLQAKQDGRIGAVVIDELTHVGNPSSGRSKAILALCNKTPAVPYVVGMTGTPGTNPDAVFGMCLTVNPVKLPARRKDTWLGMTTIKYGAEPWQRKLSPDAPEMFRKTMTPAIRFAKKDVLDLPPITVQNRYCSLSKEQQEVRKQFVDDAIALLDSGETITAANGGVLFQKLMQVAQGFVHDNSGKVIDLAHDDRTKTVIEAIAETNHKVVILCCYRHAIEDLLDSVRNAGYTAECIHGGTATGKRAQILSDFQNKDYPHVLIAHMIPLSYGVELSAADTLIFASPPPLGDFLYAQALERLSSAKQTASNINVIRIAATAEERDFYKRLDEGQNVGRNIAALFENLRKSA